MLCVLGIFGLRQEVRVKTLYSPLTKSKSMPNTLPNQADELSLQQFSLAVHMPPVQLPFLPLLLASRCMLLPVLLPLLVTPLAVGESPLSPAGSCTPE